MRVDFLRADFVRVDSVRVDHVGVDLMGRTRIYFSKSYKLLILVVLT